MFNFYSTQNVSVDRVCLCIERFSMDLSLSCSPPPILDFKFLYVTMNLPEKDYERGNVLHFWRTLIFHLYAVLIVLA